MGHRHNRSGFLSSLSRPRGHEGEHLKLPLNPRTTLSLNPLLPLLRSGLLQLLHIPTISLPPLGVDILRTKIRAAVSFLRTNTVLDREAQAQEFPRILPKALDFKVLVARNADQFLVVQRGAWEDRVDAAGLVVLVPAAAGVFPDGVLDPFLVFLR